MGTIVVIKSSGQLGVVVGDFIEDGLKVGWSVRVTGTEGIKDVYGSDITFLSAGELEDD